MDINEQRQRNLTELVDAKGAQLKAAVRFGWLLCVAACEVSLLQEKERMHSRPREELAERVSKLKHKLKGLQDDELPTAQLRTLLSMPLGCCFYYRSRN